MATTFNTPFIPKPDPGFRLADARAFYDALVNFNSASSAYNITAAGTNQATSLPLTAVINEIDTVASGTGVSLPNTAGPRSTPYQFCVVINNGANNVQVYSAIGTTDTITGIAGSTGVAVPPGNSIAFISAQKGKWFVDTGNISGGSIVGLGSGTTVFFGGGTSTFPMNGNLTEQVFGATAAEPSATGADYVLAVFSIPANSFSASGKGLEVQASGGYGATANTKTVKIIYNPSAAVVGSTVTGGTTIATTGALTQSGTGWLLNAAVFKYGAANSNTQYAQQLSSTSGTVAAGVGVPLFPTATENAAILVAVTGNAATAVSDINLNLFVVNASN